MDYKKTDLYFDLLFIAFENKIKIIEKMIFQSLQVRYRVV